jgi:hypothetical protein
MAALQRRRQPTSAGPAAGQRIAATIDAIDAVEKVLCYRLGETGYHWYCFCLGSAWLYPHRPRLPARLLLVSLIWTREMIGRDCRALCAGVAPSLGLDSAAYAHNTTAQLFRRTTHICTRSHASCSHPPWH